MTTNATPRVHPDEPAEGREDAGSAPEQVDNQGQATEDGHQTGGGHDDMGPGPTGS